MTKRASEKQISYLQHILQSQNLHLSQLTSKTCDELLHIDIIDIFSKLDIPITPNFSNLRYVINKETEDYIIGKQYNRDTNTCLDILCFKNLMVLDWDLSSESKSDLLKKITDKLKTAPYTFYIYETFNGYHGYCVSKSFNHYNLDTLTIMKSLDCDRFYIGFTRKIGFVIRLNKKTGRNETFIERFVKQINNFPIIPKLNELIEFKDSILITK